MTYDTLFRPLDLHGLSLKNRLVMAPMTRGRAGDSRVPNELMAEYYHQRSGCGLIISEATSISEQGLGWIGSPGIYTAEMVNGWKIVNNRLADTGTPIFLQLWHCGRASHSDFHNGELPVSASAVRLEGDGINTPFGKKEYETPRELTVEEIHSIVEDYKQAAINSREAGFAGLEVHSANGYLLNQFLDAKTNRRTDEYGGSFENRFRLLKEVLQAVTGVWPSNRVGVRLSPNGVFNDMGSPDFRELYLFVAEQLNGFDLAYLHIMDGLGFGFHEQGEPMTLEEFRKVYTGVIIGNCGYTAEMAVERIEAGVADLAAFGRPFITNPDLPERLKNGWPLAPAEDMSNWYTPGPKGYTDYPVYGDEPIQREQTGEGATRE